jgi:hypothetical protein
VVLPTSHPPSASTSPACHVLVPQRSFVSQTPSIVGGIGSGLAGAALGAATGPLAPVAVPVLAITGAALGSGGMEAGQAAIEQAGYEGATPAEPGTPLERGARAAARGAVGEAIGLPFRGAQVVLAARTGQVLEAAESPAPVLRQDLPAGAALLERGIAGLAPRPPTNRRCGGPGGRTSRRRGRRRS